MKNNSFHDYIAGRTEKTAKPKIFSFSSHNCQSPQLPSDNRRLPKAPRYPYSAGHAALDPPCRWCGHRRGLVIVRWDGDLGFCRCGRCDAALFSIKEIGGES